MATLNEIQITDFVYNTLVLYLKERITGDVYHKGCRPANSSKEDAEIVFSSGDAEQIQQGFVYVNIFCKDINNGSGRMVLNRSRLAEFISWDNTIQSMLNADSQYRWILEETSSIIEESETKEHFVSIKLRFSRYNN